MAKKKQKQKKEDRSKAEQRALEDQSQDQHVALKEVPTERRVKHLNKSDPSEETDSLSETTKIRRQSRFNPLLLRVLKNTEASGDEGDQDQGNEDDSDADRSKAVHGILVGLREYVQVNTERFYGLWDYLIIILSITSVGMIFFQQLASVSQEFLKLFNLFDAIICGLFFIDFFFRLALAPSKRDYLKWGWIDFISSIPILDQLRWGRMFRLLRIIRAIKGTLRGHQRLERKIQDPFISVILIAFLCVFLGAISVLHLESEVDGSNIKSAKDAIWWALVTVTTVGYGDFTPITNEGRIVAVVLMSAGIGIFGVFSVQCTQYLMSHQKKDEDRALAALQAEVSSLRAELRELSSLLKQSVEHTPSHLAGEQEDQES